MVSLLLPPNTDDGADDIWKDLPPEVHSQASILLAETRGLLSPLTLAATSDEVKLGIERAEETYMHLNTRFLGLMIPYFKQGLSSLSSKWSDNFRARVSERSGMFSADARETLLQVVESAEAYSQWLGDLIPSWGGRVTITPLDLEMLAEIAQTTSRGQMCLTAIAAVLNDKLDWRPEGLDALIDAADDYWAEVEDVFLAMRDKQGESDSETVSISDLRQRLAV